MYRLLVPWLLLLWILLVTNAINLIDGLDGLVIPGGESTTMLRLMGLYGLDDAIRAFPAPIFGTCAGMIVLDRERLGL